VKAQTVRTDQISSWWPPPEEILSGKSAGVVGESRNQGKNGLPVIAEGGNKKLKNLKEHSENGRHESELSEKEILQRVWKILDKSEVHHKEWTGGWIVSENHPVTFEELLKIDPQVKTLIASGYSADASVKDTIELGAKGFVTKPFRVKELLRDVRRVLDEG